MGTISSGLRTPARAALSESERRRDRQLLERVAGGDVEALRTLYVEHAPRARAIANRVLRGFNNAEDVVQETFFDLWRRAAQFDPHRGGAIAWVVTIARSRAIDRLRAEATESRMRDEAAATLTPAPAPGPDELTERRADCERVDRALGKLPAKQRLAVELAYWEGLSQREIAERTGEPLGTVKMRVRLAMAKLSDMLRAAA